MNIKLFYTPGTRAIRPRWLLEELGLDYSLEHIDLFKGAGETAEYKTIHPLGSVPAIEIDGNVMFESGAMCAWLTDLFPEKNLAPEITTVARQQYEQWMYFAPGSLEPPIFYAALHTKILPEEIRIPEIVPWCMDRFDQALQALDSHLKNREYITGNTFTTADIMIGSCVLWAQDHLEKYPVLQKYTTRLTERAAYGRATAN